MQQPEAHATPNPITDFAPARELGQSLLLIAFLVGAIFVPLGVGIALVRIIGG